MMGGQHYEQKSAQRERQIAALEVDAAARVVYCWRESDPDQVWPIPFDRIIMPLVLTRGPMPR